MQSLTKLSTEILFKILECIENVGVVARLFNNSMWELLNVRKFERVNYINCIIRSIFNRKYMREIDLDRGVDLEF